MSPTTDATQKDHARARRLVTLHNVVAHVHLLIDLYPHDRKLVAFLERLRAHVERLRASEGV